MTDIPTACIDPLALDAAITYRTTGGQHRIMYTSAGRFSDLVKLHGDRITGQATRVHGGWVYHWQTQLGIDKAQMFHDRIGLDAFVAAEPDKQQQ